MDTRKGVAAVTETEWVTGTELDPMLRWLCGSARGNWWSSLFGGTSHRESTPFPKPSDRKLILFACACCIPLWDLLVHLGSRQAVETAERFADGEASKEELAKARTAAASALSSFADTSLPSAIMPTMVTDRAMTWAGQAAVDLTSSSPATAIASQVAHDVARTAEEVAAWDTAWAARIWNRAPFLREIFGKPFRPTAINPAWLHWHDNLIPQMAQNMYEESTFVDLPILSDALIDAGCANQDIIDHCRSKEPHVRGCWVVDLLLGKS